MKRVLIVYHSFDEWEMGPIRLRRIARNLSAQGYQPVVLTSAVTSRSTGAVPPGVEVLRAKGFDLAELYRGIRGGKAAHASGPKGGISRGIGITSIINRWLMVPDKQIPWKRAAIQLARDYLREHPVDLIFASLAPRTNLLVAEALAREFKLPCVMEFRDLWTGSPYYHLTQPTPFHRWLHARLERKAIGAATRLSCVCRGLKDYLTAHYGDTLKQPIEVNYNFFDPSEYPPKVAPDNANTLVISYVGTMYVSRNPFSFFEGMRLFIDAHKLTPEQFRFEWAGAVLGIQGLEETLDRLRLGPYIKLIGQVRHDEALARLCQSDASLIIQSPGDSTHIPGKLFEAMGARVPVFAVSEPCEVTEIIERTACGMIVSHDPAAIAAGLSRLWEIKSGRALWNFNESELVNFRVDRAVGKLARLFDATIGS